MSLFKCSSVRFLLILGWLYIMVFFIRKRILRPNYVFLKCILKTLFLSLFISSSSSNSLIYSSVILFFFIILQYLCIWNWNVINHTLITCYVLAIGNITFYVIIFYYCMFFGFVILSKLVSLNYTYPIRRNISFIVLKVLLNKFMHYHLEVFRVWIILGIKFLIAANRILIIKC